MEAVQNILNPETLIVVGVAHQTKRAGNQQQLLALPEQVEILCQGANVFPARLK